MKAHKRPIQRSLVLGCIVFVLLLCLLLAVQAYLLFSNALYRRHDAELSHVVNYVGKLVDADDLRECIRSGRKSEKYEQLQQFLNGFVDDFELAYLYIVIPVDDETGTMINVISATSAAERAAGETDMPLLDTTDAYPREEIERYLKAWEQPGLSYFEEVSDYGTCYTGCKPLVTSDGETIALVCADVLTGDLHRSVNVYVLVNVLLTVAIGLVFGAVLIVWLRRNVTGPVLALEKSAQRFAERSNGTKDLHRLSFEVPAIRVKNEVESLARAMEKMSEDMRSYVEDVLSAEARARRAEKTAENMSTIAYQDALTHVKSKAAYEQKKIELERQIAAGGAQFALLMVDLNELKNINDTYGHECGDKYLIGACGVVCVVYKHSPVYRVGGDEFVVLLQGQDYENREALLAALREEFAASNAASGREPWERYSAAAGMAEYTGAPGEDVEQVLRRADEEMYRDKEKIKNALPV